MAHNRTGLYPRKKRVEKPQTYVLMARFMLRDKGWYPAARGILEAKIKGEFGSIPWVQVDYVIIEKEDDDG